MSTRCNALARSARARRPPPRPHPRRLRERRAAPRRRVPPPAGTPLGSGLLGARAPGTLAEPRGMRRRDRKKKKVVDEKLVLESVRKTLASLDTGARRRHRRHDDENGEVGTEEAKVIRATEFITVA